MSDPGQRLPRLTLILDVNAYVTAALTPRGPAGQILAAAVSGEVALVTSPLLLEELRDVLVRPQFRRWLSEQEVADFITAITLLARSQPDPERDTEQQISRDPDDDYLLVLVADPAISFLVTGDRDLLIVEYGSVKVRTRRRSPSYSLLTTSGAPRSLRAAPKRRSVR